MNDRAAEVSPKTFARIAGGLSLLLFVLGPFIYFYVPSKILVNGDAVATSGNLVTFESLLRFGMVGESVIFLTEVALAAIL